MIHFYTKKQCKYIAETMKTLQGDMNAADFGAMLGVSDFTIYSIYEGASQPYEKTMQAIANLRGQSLAAFLDEINGIDLEGQREMRIKYPYLYRR